MQNKFAFLQRLLQQAKSSHVTLLRISQHTVSLVGLCVLVAMLFVLLNPNWRDRASDAYLAFTQASPVELEPEVVADVLPIPKPDPKLVSQISKFKPAAVKQYQDDGLTDEQFDAIRGYISTKYRVSSEVTDALVKASFGTAQDLDLDPLLLLSVMAIESNFNPFAESTGGAQGLMQVMTRVHKDKFETFGGRQAAWNPIANIRVGARILKDCVNKGGSLEAGLRLYVGSTGTPGYRYGVRVLAERDRLAAAAGLSEKIELTSVDDTTIAYN